jgi:Fe-S-cluster-containing dehydrogenase component
VDLTRCIGCRKCEQACAEVNGLPQPERSFEDLTVLDAKRRPDERSYTVVNRYVSGKIDERDQLVPTFVKLQCMHCQDPACASACIVGALTKKENGAVHYDVTKCIGCRYCMVACPFEIPAYEYHDPITPRVMKCTFCYERVQRGQTSRVCGNLSGGSHHVRPAQHPAQAGPLSALQKNPAITSTMCTEKMKWAAPAGCTCPASAVRQTGVQPTAGKTHAPAGGEHPALPVQLPLVTHCSVRHVERHHVVFQGQRRPG